MSRSISPPWISNYVQQRLKSLRNPTDENQRYHQNKKKEPKVVQVLGVYPEQSSLLISDTVNCIEIFMSMLCKEKLSSSFRETGNLKDLKLCQIKIEEYHLSTFVQCASHFDIEAHMRLNKRSPPLTLHCSKITYLGAQDCEKMGSPQEINSCPIVRDLISGLSYRFLYDGLGGLQFPAQKQLPDLENKFPVPSEISDENPASVGIFVVPETALRTRVLASISFEQAEMIRLQSIPNNAGVELSSETLHEVSAAAADQPATEEQWSQSQTFNWVETWTETQVDEFAGTQIDAEVHENEKTAVTGASQVVISVEDSPDRKRVVEQSVEVSGTLVDDTVREFESVDLVGTPIQHRPNSRETQNSGSCAIPGIQPALSAQSVFHVLTETLVDTLTETLEDVSVLRNPSDRTSAVLGSTVVSSAEQQSVLEGSGGDEKAASNQKKRKRADQEYIGCRVQKMFEGEWYRGTVISCRKVKLKRTAVNYSLLWLIKYEDDDKEEMSTFELKRTLQIESSAAATPSSIVRSPTAPSNTMLGDLYINRRVRKMFNDKKMYEGTVTSSRILKNGQRWWFITYDDGDEEEMSTRMLKRFLQDASGSPSRLPTAVIAAAAAASVAPVAPMAVVANDGSHSQNSNGTLPDNLIGLETVVVQDISSQNKESSAALETLVDDHHPVQINDQILSGDTLGPQSNSGDNQVVPDQATLHGEGLVAHPVEEQVDRRHRNGRSSISESSIAVSRSRKVGLLPSGRSYLMGEMKIRGKIELPPRKCPPRSLDEMIRLLYK